MEVVYRPETVIDALKQMATKKFTVLAGGTDLMVQHAHHSSLVPQFPYQLLVTDHLHELKSITKDGECLQIGAGCTLTQIINDPLVPELLKNAIKQIAAPALRNRATLIGNICNASPAGDSLPVLYLFDCQIQLSTMKGCEWLPLCHFITGPGKTTRQPEQLITAVKFVVPKIDYSLYRKVGTRSANALTKLSVAGLVSLHSTGEISDFRLAFGAVGPTVIRNRDIEALIVGKRPEQVNINELSEQYNEVIMPIDDQRSTAKYRRAASLNILKEWLMQLEIESIDNIA
ncbi:FAD binding domain-containing protein [Vibrio sp. SS-MA-C1-2]|uniref:FAD binding domain-containing protein n=1 Tax=Vibrio sp. SS-MA-C1-2 TaxID=2908646 RepID=UPI001F175DED|nr:FAD binding domain-containing protein [Vibrio sp. SS-MA-C1-2]UJF18334.1 FAD binding domain-containing protein [Vibrio sp. SS-MA-C1-2]